MKVKVYPSVCTGEIQIPPSKSMAHRAIMCASLAKGKSVISNIAYSDDILAVSYTHLDVYKRQALPCISVP